MKITYWYAECLDDANAYSVRAKTKKACKAEVAERGGADFGPPVKVTIEYRDAFHLVEQLMGEGSGCDEACAVLDHREKGR